MTFATFLSSVQIASRSLIRDPKQLRWTILSIGVVALASAQTPGFVLLILCLSYIIRCCLTQLEHLLEAWSVVLFYQANWPRA
jgi:hypothetical protein